MDAFKNLNKKSNKIHSNVTVKTFIMLQKILTLNQLSKNKKMHHSFHIIIKQHSCF